MGFDVDWMHGAEHMRAEHQVTVVEANEALADADARLFDPDPKGNSGASARVIGYSPTAVAVLVVTLVRREDKPGAWWARTHGAPTAVTGEPIERECSHEQRREATRRADRG